MRDFVFHIITHIGLLAVICSLFGVALRKWFSDKGLKPNTALIPFYNLTVWLRALGLPGWLVLVVFQGYWYPAWWVETIGAVLLGHLVLQTLKRYRAIPFVLLWYLLFALLAGLLYYNLNQYANLIHLSLGSLCFIILLSHRKPMHKPDSESLVSPGWKQSLRTNVLARIAFAFLGFIIIVALYAPYLANSLPVYARIANESYLPITESLKNPGGAKESSYRAFPWKECGCAVMPLIPYSPEFQDAENRNFVGPGEEQVMRDIGGSIVPISDRYRHVLGTDRIGRDVFSGLIHGSGTALTVGFVAMGIAAVLGIFLGGIAGYYGNTGLFLTRFRFIFLILGLFLGYFYGFVARDWSVKDMESAGGNPFVAIAIKWFIFLGVPAFLFWISGKFTGGGYLGKRVVFPIDTVISRVIEILYSIPGILLIIVISASVPEKSLTMVMIIIGLISWTGVARLTRAEFLRLKQMEYIESAKALGFGNTRIIVHHILPNALGPAFVAIAFGMAGAILLESSLSFLGIGVPEDAVTWGSMLKTAFVNNSSDKIWLVMAPGIAIFTVVTLYNLLGESLRDAIDPKLRK